MKTLCKNMCVHIIYMEKRALKKISAIHCCNKFSNPRCFNVVASTQFIIQYTMKVFPENPQYIVIRYKNVGIYCNL